MRTAILVVIAWFLASSASAADRVALLIGNNNYAGSPLRNAVNDARDLARSAEGARLQASSCARTPRART